MLKYFEFNPQGEVTKTNCMKCNDTIATAKTKTGADGKERQILTPWSHYKAYEVILTDGSFACLPMCTDCHQKIDSRDFKDLEKKMHLGWMAQQLQKYRNDPQKKAALISAAEMSRSKHILRSK